MMRRSDLLQRPEPHPCIFSDVNSAVAACVHAQRQYEECGKSLRRRVVSRIRQTIREYGRQLASHAARETGRGRVEDKLIKNLIVAEKTPGCEDLLPSVSTGDHGLTVIATMPYGVMASITPVTNPTATVINNCISMLAGGNGVVFHSHPSAEHCTALTLAIIHDAIMWEGAPANLIVGISHPTIFSASVLMDHEKINAIMVTGGRQVVQRALRTGKKAFCAGPGNPPVIVDETADLKNAARCIIAGASFDNNMVCSDEKAIFAVGDETYLWLIEAFREAGAYVLSKNEIRKCLLVMFRHLPEDGQIEAPLITEHVGMNASTLLAKAGIIVPETCRLAVAPVHADHLMVVTEQMMPIIPLCLVGGWKEAISAAVKCENGRRHSASIHTKKMERVGELGQAIRVSNLVVNAPIYCGLGVDAQGYTSFSIAGFTGEGYTRPSSFVRQSRLTCPDVFNFT